MALAFALNTRAAAVNGLLALLAGAAVAGSMASRAIVAWWAAVALSLVVRLAVGAARRRDLQADARARHWSRAISLALAGTGLAWGCGAAWMLDPADALREAFWVVALCGIGAGAVSALRHHVPALWAYLLPLLLPAIWRYARLPEPAQQAVAGGLALFLVVSLAQGRQGARALHDSLAMRADNARLVDELTERNAQALAAQHLAEEAAAAKARFFAAASHDLRQPMQALLLLDAALAEAPAPARPALQARMGDGLRDLSRLFEDILETSHLDAGAPRPALRPLPLPALAQQLQARFADLADAQGMALSWRCSRRTPAALADATALERLLGNLLSNALRHARPAPDSGGGGGGGGGSVLLALRHGDGGTVRLQVRDAGQGIAAEQQARVFEEFYQVGNPHRARRQGTGLGLAIAQRLADALGSRITLRSAPGRGCCFELRLPMAAPSELPAPADAPAGAQLDDSLQGLQVWLVDDDERVRAALASLLDTWGVQVLAVADGDALPPLAAGRPADGRPPPDVLLCDQMLAGGDGVALARRLHGALSPPPRVLMVSGDIDPAARQRALAGGFQWLAKPVKPAALRAWLAAGRIHGIVRE